MKEESASLIHVEQIILSKQTFKQTIKNLFIMQYYL